MLQLESGKAWDVRNSISSDEFQSESHKSYRKDVSGYIGTDTLRCGSMLNCIMLIGSFGPTCFLSARKLNGLTPVGQNGRFFNLKFPV